MSLLGKLIPHFDRQQRAIEEYNLGFHAKYAGDWEKSLFHNQRAAELNPEDEATWWNLGIAATALHNWPEARRAWLACGVKLQPGEGEVAMPELMGCVRIDPSGRGEVVWGRRIDPARIRVLNVPFPFTGTASANLSAAARTTWLALPTAARRCGRGCRRGRAATFRSPLLPRHA